MVDIEAKFTFIVIMSIMCCIGVHGVISMTVVPTQIESSSSFELRCNIPLLAGIVRISKDGRDVGSCTAPIPGIINGECVPENLRQSIITNDTVLTIDSADPPAHHGEWKCRHASKETVKFVTIFVFPKVLSGNNDEINDTIDAIEAGETQFRVNVSECVNPEPEIVWFIKKCNNTPADTGVSKNPDVQLCPSVECDTPQHQYSSSLKVKDMTRTLEDVCYMTLASLTYPGTDFPALVFSFNTNVWFRGTTTTMQTPPMNPTSSSPLFYTTTKSSTDVMAIYVVPSQLESSTAFEVRCYVPLLAGIVKFLKDGNAIGICTSPIPGIIKGECVPENLQQSIATNETVLKIKTANLSAHHGEWKCQHVSEETVKFITIYAFPTVLSNNQNEINETLNVVNAGDTMFRVHTSECVNPKPEIMWFLKKCNGSEAQFSIENNPLVQSHPSEDCLSPQRKYTSSLKVKDIVRPTEETCYMVSALLTYPGSSFSDLISCFTTFIMFGDDTSTTQPTSTGSTSGIDKKEKKSKRNLAPVIGIVIGIVVAIIVGLIVIITCRSKLPKFRNVSNSFDDSKPNPVTEPRTGDYDYIALDDDPSKTKSSNNGLEVEDITKHNAEYLKKDEQEKKKNESNTPPQPVVYAQVNEATRLRNKQKTEAIDSIGKQEEDTYAETQDGIYDKAGERRHKENKNVEHYDSSNNSSKQNSNGDSKLAIQTSKVGSYANQGFEKDENRKVATVSPTVRSSSGFQNDEQKHSNRNSQSKQGDENIIGTEQTSISEDDSSHRTAL